MPNTFQIWKKLTQNLLKKRQYARWSFTRWMQTIHSYSPQFEKVEWNKLVWAEIEARKFVLGQQKK